MKNVRSRAAFFDECQGNDENNMIFVKPRNCVGESYIKTRFLYVDDVFEKKKKRKRKIAEF